MSRLAPFNSLRVSVKCIHVSNRNYSALFGQPERERESHAEVLGDVVGNGRVQEGLHCWKKPPAHDLVVDGH
jgi:hypothetical protein